MNITTRIVNLQELLGDIQSDLKSWLTDANGKHYEEKLNDRQALLYELVICHTYLQAAEALVDYSGQAVGSDFEPLCQLSTRYFVNDALAQIRCRLVSVSSEYTQPLMRVEELTAPLAEARELSAQQLAKIGHQFIALKGGLGVDFMSEEQRLARDAARKISDSVVAPQASRIHQQNLTIPDDIINEVREFGCFGLSIPQKYGGLLVDGQEDCLGMLLVTEELSRGSLGAAGSLITRPEILARALLAGGTEEQKQQWLPKLAAGTPLCAVSITEPDTGSDVAAIKLKATKTADGWLLNGTKSWCTLAGKAGVIMLLARTDPNLILGHRGLSLFLVEKQPTDDHSFEIRQPGGGVLIGNAIPTLGYRGMHSFEMFYDQYLVPDTSLLGHENGLGKGFYLTMEGFVGGRIQTAARACGLMRAAYEAALEQAEIRQVFGQPLKQHQLTACKLAKMAINILACQQLTYATGRLLNQGKGQVEASLAKIFACRTAEWVTREAMQIYGGIGYAEETSVSRYWADARVLSIFEGAEEVLALKVVGRSLLEHANP